MTRDARRTGGVWLGAHAKPIGRFSTDSNNQLLADTGGVLADDALFVVSIGANDFSSFGRPDSEAAARVGIVAGQVSRLHGAGARRFPVFQVSGANAFASNFNVALADALDVLPDLQRLQQFDRMERQ